MIVGVAVVPTLLLLFSSIAITITIPAAILTAAANRSGIVPRIITVTITTGTAINVTVTSEIDLRLHSSACKIATTYSSGRKRKNSRSSPAV
jgi:hypothetical protein